MYIRALLLSGVICSINYYTNGQVVFEEQTFKVFENVYRSSLAHGDIDNDGDQDVLITGYSGNIAITKLYSNDGNGVFTEITGTPFEGVSSGSSAFADVDNDGDKDLLITGYNNSNQRITKLYKNNGSGVFSEVQGTPFDKVNFSSIAFADVDNDSDQDLLITGFNENNQRIAKLYINNGSGTFSVVAGTPFEGVSFGSVAFADVNNDGRQDIFITGENTAEQPVAKLYMNNGTGSFSEAVGTPFQGVYNSSIAVADIDNDGNKDIIITGKSGYSQDISRLYKNNGNGSFTHVSAANLESISSGSVAFADIEGDGDQDVLIIGYSIYYGLVARLYKNNGSGTFTQVTNHALKPRQNGAIAFTDIDNDGDIDLLSTGLTPLNQGSSVLYTNDGNGVFTDTSTPFIGMSYSQIAFADIDNDGDQDVLVTGSETASLGKTMLYRNDGTGVYTLIANAQLMDVRRGSIAFADIDNDGDQDLLVTGQTNSNQTLAKLYSNDGTGVFTEISGTPFTGILSGAIAFADVDNDGDQDVFITGNNANLPSSKLYINNGTGTFTLSPSTFTQVYSSMIAFGDIDNDGDQDLLMSGSQSSSSSSLTKLYRNNGTGVLTEDVNASFPPLNTGSLTFEDVDNDGDLDLFIAGKSTSSQDITRLYFNDGTGTYTQDTGNTFPQGFFSSVAFSDVDNDGDKDLLFTGLVNTPLTKFYLNDGSGLFSEYLNVPFANVSAGCVAFADVDADGDPDVLITGDQKTILYKNISCFFIDLTTTLTGHTITANESGAMYNWLDCNNDYLPIGVTTQSFTPVANGSYAVEITQPGGCSATSACVQISDLGIKGSTLDEKLVLFPNPAGEQLTIQADFTIESYSILDLGGRVVKQESFSNGTIDLSTLESGSYIVCLKAEGRQIVRNIIKR
jgi:predicted nucleotidyltransferase